MKYIEENISYLISSKGKKRYFLCFILGTISAYAFAPYFVFPLFPLTIAAFLFVVITSKNPKQAFWAGWFYGFGHFVFGLYWISNSLLVDPEKFAWMIPFAISLIPAVLAFYVALTSWVTFKFISSNKKRILLFPVIWVVFEILRTYLFTGFPWNLAGYVFAFSDAMMQPAALITIYGLSFLAVLSGSILCCLFSVEGRKVSSSGCFIPAVMVYAFISVLFVSGFGYLHISDKYYASQKEGINLRLVQPSIPQQMKWHPDAALQVFLKHIEMTKTDNGFKPDMVIWPEAATPFTLGADPYARRVISEAIPEGSFLVTGGVRVDGYGAFNSVEVLNSSDEIVASYDKARLVPFGEFVPFRRFFPIVNKITPGDTDFSRGGGASALSVGNITPFSPLVCYEVIFPFYKPDESTGYSWIVNVTNDAWFGDSSGPHQHLTMARFRAIEQGKPVIRVANNGISAIIDANGRMVKKLDLYERGIIDGNLPAKMDMSIATIYFCATIAIAVFLAILCKIIYRRIKLVQK